MNLNGTTDNDLVFHPPRPFRTLAPISAAIGMTCFIAIFPLSIILSESGVGTIEYLFLVFTILAVGVISFSLIYFPKSDYLFIFSRSDRQIKRFYKGDLTNIFDLKKSESILSKETFANDKMHYVLMLIGGRDKRETLIDISDGSFEVSAKQWHGFAERVAVQTGLQFNKEIWGDDHNGNIVRKEGEDRTRNKIISFSMTVFAVATSYWGAFGFNLDPSMQSFLKFGLIVVFANIILSTYLYDKLQVKFIKQPTKTSWVISHIYKSFSFYTFWILYIKLNAYLEDASSPNEALEKLFEYFN